MKTSDCQITNDATAGHIPVIYKLEDCVCEVWGFAIKILMKFSTKCSALDLFVLLICTVIDKAILLKDIYTALIYHVYLAKAILCLLYKP